MTVLRTWFFGVVAASIVLSVLYAMVPKGAILTVAKCTGGLILLLVVLKPLLSSELPSLLSSYDWLSDDIALRTEDYTAQNRQALARLISERTAAYISEKAARLGIVCTAEVQCTADGDVPVPAEVTLDVPYDGALAQYMETELGIDTDSQHWKG